MTEISLTINERTYQVTCDDGQEDHLRRLAGHLDERIQGLVGAVGQVGESRLLVMASLMFADELFEAYKENHALKAADGSAGGGAQLRGSLRGPSVTVIQAGRLRASRATISPASARPPLGLRRRRSGFARPTQDR